MMTLEELDDLENRAVEGDDEALDRLREEAMESAGDAAIKLAYALLKREAPDDELRAAEQVLLPVCSVDDEMQRGGACDVLFWLRMRLAFRPPKPARLDELEADWARRVAAGEASGEPDPADDWEAMPVEQRIASLERAAAEGSAEACGEIATYWAERLEGGRFRDLDAAIFNARLAAMGNAWSWASMAGRLLQKRRAAGDIEESVWWLRQVAEDDRDAAFTLAFNYANGEGVPSSRETAVAFWNYAAWRYTRAATLLGEALLHGIGAPRDVERGLSMLEGAAKEKDPYACDLLGSCYDDGIGVARDGQRAREYFQRAAEGGSAIGQLNLGTLLFDGRGCEPDLPEAARWLEKAAGSGWEHAMHLLAMMLYRGEGIPRDTTRAEELFEKARKKLHLPTLFTTLPEEARRFRAAATGVRDVAGVFLEAARAGEAGHAEAAFEAALAFWNPEGNITQDSPRAIRLFRIAADGGHVLAKACLSEALRVDGKTEEADRWLWMAATDGLEGARNRLIDLGEDPCEKSVS